MANKPSDVILKVKRNIEKDVEAYARSEQFKNIAATALIDFIKRVKRGIMPGMGAIPGFTNKKYVDLRTKNRSSLGDLAKPNKSNATATGQMLEAMVYKMKTRGFTLFVSDKSRTKELSGASSKLNNAEVAEYYALKRKIFDFSDPELKRIIRNIKTDLLGLIRRTK